MTVRSQRDLDGLIRVGRVVSLAIKEMKRSLRAGATTQELDTVCAKILERCGARPAPQHDYGFPGAACISVNDEAVHGIPGPRAIRAGDLVKLDVTAELDGYVADAAVTVVVPSASRSKLSLARCARAALYRAIEVARAGRPINVIGKAVQGEVEAQGFNVMPELGGHGVGREIHEAPQVHNYYAPWDDKLLTPGLVIAIEPVVSAGSGKSVQGADGWTVKTADGADSAHYEHSVVIRHGRPLVLTA